jgi:hypothetical protein
MAHANFLQPTGPIETTLCDYETVESVNEELYNNLSELVRLPFFRYFRVRFPSTASSTLIASALTGRSLQRMSFLA